MKKSLTGSLTGCNHFRRCIFIAAVLFFSATQKSSAQTVISIGKNIDSAKVTNGTALIYTAKAKHKLYGIFKDNALVDWYAEDMNGNRLNTSASKSTTVCAVCITQNGVKTCYNCVTVETNVQLTSTRAN
jgi:hypothetical protein